MKIFISYRRDDTGGRAGRLFDVLAARYGSRDVFLDVTAVAPGTPFDERVDAAIRASDVVLVVIGPRWLNGGSDVRDRRIDHADDYVRHEVRAALTGDVRVIPVLVDGATLPPADELPDDLRTLVRRQAVAVRDEAWHRDVDELVRWLEGRPSTTSDTLVPSRRPWALIGGAVTAAVVVAGAITAVALRDGGDGDTSADEPAVCAEPTGDATNVDVDGDAVDAILEGYNVRIEPRGGRHRIVDDQYHVEVDVAISNTGSPQSGTFDDDIYVSYAYVTGVVVGGVKTDRIICTRYVGIQQLPPGQTVVATFGYASEVDPAGARISLELNPEGEVPIGTG